MLASVFRFAQRLAWAVLCIAATAGPVWAEHGELVPAQQMVRAIATVEGETQSYPVDLPFSWDKFRPGMSGRVTLDMEFDVPLASQYGHALVMYRVGNGYTVSVNGMQQEHFGDLGQHFSTDAKLPRLIPITLPIESHNQLRIVLRADAGRQASLSRVDLLPVEQARELFDSYWRVRVLLREGVGIFSALVGLIGLALWLTQGSLDAQGRFRRERIYLFGGVAELAWVLRVSDGLIEVPPVPLPVWSVLASVSLGVWASLTLLFCAEAIGWGQHRRMALMRGVLGAMLLLGVVCATAAWNFQKPWALTVWYLLLGVGFLSFGVVYLRAAFRPTGNLQSRLLAVAIVINVLMGLVDLFQQRIAPNAAAGAYLYAASVLFGLAAGATVLTRFRQVSLQAQQLTRHLSSMVEQKEEQLRQSFQRMAELAREQARTQERARVLRDLHDGVGAHLSVAMRQLEAEHVARGQVLATLRESMDHLKLSIDAIHLLPGDVGMVLANVRYRFEPRLRDAGITLHWNVQGIEPLGRLNDRQMRDVQYITYGVLSNVLQHAAATDLDVSACEEDGVVRLRFTDNGRGFDARAPLRPGLMSLIQRAQALGGELEITSEPGQTRVELLLPRTV